MNHASHASTRTALFARLKAMFEFDAQGVLPCMAPGMSGPLAIPIGYMDLTDVALNGQRIGAILMLTWSAGESAKLYDASLPAGKQSSAGRDASTEELRCALEHYENAVHEYRETVLRRCVAPGEDAPLWLQQRLGLAPFYTPKVSEIC